MAQSGVLCEYCTKIPFEPGLTNFLDDTYDEVSWDLGTFEQVRSRTCPFCTLMVSICSQWTTGSGSWSHLVEPDDTEPISARWSSDGFDAHTNSRLGSAICVADNHKPQGVLYAREKLDPWINWNEVRRWISQCRGNHEECTGPDKSSLNFVQHRLRLVDVEECCIVEATKSYTYVALSYVWGDPKDGRLLLLQENWNMLQQPKSLQSLQPLIPATIRDAITATKEIGQRYLWVDSLCLTQDNPKELQECVTYMDRIYHEAIVTIVAAAGTDAHAGLPGVNPTMRQTQRLVKEIIPGLRMTTVHDLDSLLRPSRYSQRGWTMQEEVLSRRILFFINDQIYFRCQECTFSEAMNIPGQPLKNYNRNFSLYPMLLTNADGFSDFTYLILYYTARSLSHDSDVLRAAQGMLNRYASLNKIGLIEGLPCPLEQSLLFLKSGFLKQGTNSLSFRREGFPSYSWIGWRAMASWDDALSYVTLLPDSPPNNSQSTDTSSQETTLRTWIRWHVVCRQEIFLIDVMGNRQPSRASDTDNFLDRCRQEFRNYSAIRENHNVHKACTGIPYTVLFFWTVCVNLGVGRPAKPNVFLVNAEPSMHYEVLNDHGENCGEVALDINLGEGVQDGLFALIAGTLDGGFWALLLKRLHNGQMERGGLARLYSNCLDGNSNGRPRWERICLV